MSLLQLDPPLWLDTPKGEGLAHILIDYGAEHDLIWVCFITETREVWGFSNQEIKAAQNITLGRKKGRVTAEAIDFSRKP